MRRENQETYEITNVSGETVRAYIPSPLPPKPDIDLGEIRDASDRALIALGRLDGISKLLPDRHLFIYFYIRREAVLSSQIEGTQSSLSDLMLFELPGVIRTPTDDIIEVSNYVRALEYGLERLETLTISSRLIREIHSILLSSGRGSTKTPGEFRRSQVWIGGSRPGNAHFVPAPPAKVAKCMGELEQFIHSDSLAMNPLVQAGITHVQFETIHPFLDGNGRAGRLLIPFLLCKSGLLSEPLLYLSLYFKENRQDYYELLDEVRRTGNWEAWLNFFLEGVVITAEAAVGTAHRLLEVFEEDESLVRPQGRSKASAMQVHSALKAFPLITVPEIRGRTGLSAPGVMAGLQVLEELGIVRETTGQRRNRIYAYQRYVDILSEGTEPL